MEKLFTKEEIEIIENEANSNLEYYFDTTVLDGNATQISIKTISKINKLIFVQGNSDTGFEHLNDRHSFLSFKNYWRLNELNNLKLDDPSKFHPRMMPIIDYVKIADEIFSDENKNITKNNKPELFDKFTGNFNYNETEKYHLITYKNTKIVHSLFPDKKIYNSKLKCKFGKGLSKITIKFPDGYNDLFIPYENSDRKTVYSILFRKYLGEKVEKIFIQKHDTKEVPVEQYLLAYREYENYEKFEREDMDRIQFGNLNYFERIINEIDENK